MNRNDFLNMIEETVLVNRQMIGEVYELIDIFPYFQSAHMLLLKGLHSNADVKFESQLRLSSIHIADREVLYYLLKSKPSQDERSIEVKRENIQSENLVSNTQQTVIESAKNSDFLIEEIEKNSYDTETKENQDPDDNPVHHTMLLSTDADLNYSSGGVLLLDEEEADPEEKFFYMDPGFSLPDHGDLLELDLDSSPSDIDDDTIIQLEPENNKGENSKKQLQSELIDKFITNNPRIEPVKEKTDIPQEDIARPYNEEQESFVTETLARIYINQGYYSKAIDIFEKLSLKFPEKSSYFASQIEKVKEYLKK